LAPSAPGHATARGAVLLVVERGLTVLAGLMFAATVPRLMGPDLYGRYALLASLVVWLALFSGLGTINAIGRYVPELAARSPAALNAFLGHLLVLRVATGSVAAVTCLVLGRVWLHDVATASIALAAVAVLVHAVTATVFSAFVAFGQPARWGLAEPVRRWLLLALVVPAFLAHGLSGAFAAMLVAELSVLALGAWAGRRWLAHVELGLDVRLLAPYLRLGIGFFAAQLLFAAFAGSGEPMVRAFSGSFVEVAYFGLAHSGYLAVTMAFPDVTFAFVPLLSRLRDAGETPAMMRWIERLLIALVASAVVLLFASLLLGQALVSVVLGHAYAPVAMNLAPLSIAVLMLAVASVTQAVALVHERFRPVVFAGALRLLAFWSLGPVLVARYGALGAAVALAAATILHATTLVWLMRDTVRGSLRAPLRAAALGVVVLPFLWLRLSSPAVDILLFIAASGAYGGLLRRTGLLTKDDVSALRAALRWRRGPSAAEGVA